MRELTSDEVRAAVGGKFFRVRFTKRTNGELREMVARLGVRKSKGNPPHFDRDAAKVLCVWDMQKHAYRNIPLDAIEELSCGKIHLR